MDWADDVAYTVHDVEDGIHAGLIELSALRDADTAATMCELVATTYLPGTDPADLRAALDRLVGFHLAHRVLEVHRKPAGSGGPQGPDQPAHRPVHRLSRDRHPGSAPPGPADPLLGVA